jgi:hypothetical protein
MSESDPEDSTERYSHEDRERWVDAYKGWSPAKLAAAEKK